MEIPTLRPSRRDSRRQGMTLVETIVALALLVICGVTGMYGFMVLNRYAARERNISTAKALCQERIEQALALPYQPPAVLPAITGQDNLVHNILGTSTNYTTAGVYTGAETSPEAVTIYTSQDGNAASAVTGTRTTSVAPSGLADTTSGSALPLVQFTVTVAYTQNGEARSYSMTTMRSANY